LPKGWGTFGEGKGTQHMEDLWPLKKNSEEERAGDHSVYAKRNGQERQRGEERIGRMKLAGARNKDRSLVKEGSSRLRRSTRRGSNGEVRKRIQGVIGRAHEGSREPGER